MLKLTVLALGLCAAPAVAQQSRLPYPGGPVAPPIKNGMNCCSTQSSGFYPVNGHVGAQGICLTRKKDGKIECHSRREWEEIAGKMSATKTAS